jgi:peptidoglycan biosynthesis protein MviN/MurJ (putative lipid II flippase)
MLPILALGIWPEILNNTSGPALYALGKPQYSTLASFSRVIWTVLGILIGYAIAGVPGAVIAIALNDLFNYGFVTYGLWREGLNGITQDIQVTLFLLALISLLLIGRSSFGLGLPLDGILT